MIASPRQVTAGLCALALAVGLAACGETASTSNFKGESHNVAQTVSDFQTDATAADQKKLCENDLAVTLATSLRSAGGCQAVLKNQLHEIDALNMTIESITVSGTSAIVHVKSTYSGKSRITTLTLVKEGSRWKISDAQQ
jgi:Putative lumazine-binding